MKRMWAICWFEIKRVFKKPASYALMFGMPLVFTFIFGSLLGEEGPAKTKIAVVDEDRSNASAAFLIRLEKDESLSVQPFQLKEAERKLQEKQVSGIILIPEGYEQQIIDGSKTAIVFRHGPELAIAPTVKQQIQDVTAQTSVQIKAAQTWSRYSGDSNWRGFYEKMSTVSESPSISVDSKTVSKSAETKRMNNLSERAVGFSVMFVMITLMSVSGTILEARKTGVWQRMLATPAFKWEIMVGYMLSFFLIGWIQFAILMVAFSLLFGVQWGNWAGQIVLVSALLLSVVGLGLFIAGLVRTTEQQAAMGNILIVSTSMLGGVYWPLDIVPDVMKKIAEFVPQTWAMKGFTELMARGGSVADIAGPVAVLLGFAAVFLAAGVSRVKYE